MKIEIHCLFESPGADDRAAMESVARSLTDDLRSVRVFVIEGRPDWLAVEFAMPTQPQYQAVGAIDREIRLCVGNRMTPRSAFPGRKRNNDRPSARTRAAAQTVEARHDVGRRPSRRPGACCEPHPPEVEWRSMCCHKPPSGGGVQIVGHGINLVLAQPTGTEVVARLMSPRFDEFRQASKRWQARKTFRQCRAQRPWLYGRSDLEKRTAQVKKARTLRPN